MTREKNVSCGYAELPAKVLIGGVHLKIYTLEQQHFFTVHKHNYTVVTLLVTWLLVMQAASALCKNSFTEPVIIKKRKKEKQRKVET